MKLYYFVYEVNSNLNKRCISTNKAKLEIMRERLESTRERTEYKFLGEIQEFTLEQLEDIEII